MSSVTQPATFSDLYNDLMSRARVDANQSINSQSAKKLINTALFDMHLGNGEKFAWCERNARLLTQAPYSTGTVTISQGSASLTGSGTAWNTVNAFGVKNLRAGGRIVLPGDDTVYEVDSVSSDTTLTLTDAFRGESLSAETYSYFEDEYALASDFLRPLDKARFDARGEIEIMDRREFRRRFTVYSAPGIVVAAAIFDAPFSGSTSPRRRVRFFRPPSESRYIPYAYVTANLAVSSAGVEQTQLVEDSDEPIVPLYARHLIVLKALEHWYRDKKNDARSQLVQAEYGDGVARLLTSVEVGTQHPSLSPRLQSYTRKAKTPYRPGRSRRYTTGNTFDEFRE